MDLRGKTVVITGASSGIGAATAIAMARQGANLVLAARRTPQLEDVAAKCRALGPDCRIVRADVTVREDCTRLIAEAGTVDVLVNVAGFAIFDKVENANPDDLESMMQTNYFGTVWCTQAVLPQMLARRSGSIVNVGSIVGIMGFAGMSGYCATKFALAGFTEALRDEVMDRGIAVSLVAPSTTKTDFFVTAEHGKMPKASRLMLAMTPERVARAVVAAARNGRYRHIVPVPAAFYMRIKELFPRFAHLLMRRVSALLE